MWLLINMEKKLKIIYQERLAVFALNKIKKRLCQKSSLPQIT